MAVTIVNSLMNGAFSFKFEPLNYPTIFTLARKGTVLDYLTNKGFSGSDFEIE